MYPNVDTTYVKIEGALPLQIGTLWDHEMIHPRQKISPGYNVPQAMERNPCTLKNEGVFQGYLEDMGNGVVRDLIDAEVEAS